MHKTKDAKGPISFHYGSDEKRFWGVVLKL